MFTFFSLPFELRMEVYKLVLSPDPERLQILSVHHHLPRTNTVLNIHPVILQTNRQAYTEAASIPYDCNKFLVTVRTARFFPPGGPIYHAPSPMGLLRIDSTTPNTHARTNDTTTNLLTATALGLIYPHCLRRLRYILLLTSGLGTPNDAYTYTGEMILDFLRILRDDVPPVSGEPAKVLKLGGHWRWTAMRFTDLLEDVSKVRTVEILTVEDFVALMKADDKMRDYFSIEP